MVADRTALFVARLNLAASGGRRTFHVNRTNSKFLQSLPLNGRFCSKLAVSTLRISLLKRWMNEQDGTKMVRLMADVKADAQADVVWIGSIRWSLESLRLPWMSLHSFRCTTRSFRKRTHFEITRANGNVTFILLGNEPIGPLPIDKNRCGRSICSQRLDWSSKQLELGKFEAIVYQRI